MNTRRAFFATLLAAPAAAGAVLGAKPKAQVYDFYVVAVDFVEHRIYIACDTQEEVERLRHFSPEQEKRWLLLATAPGWRKVMLPDRPGILGGVDA